MTTLFGSWIEITGELHALSGLHVGSGESREDDRLPGKEGANEHPESARVQQDFEEKPYLPGSSLKGAMRAFCERRFGLAPDSPAITALFGEVKDEGQGRMGRLIVYGASYLRAGSVASARPLAGKLADAGRKGRAMTARTKIDPGRGTADHGLLYHAEEAPPGSVFSFTARYQPLVPPEPVRGRFEAGANGDPHFEAARKRREEAQQADGLARQLLADLLQAMADGHLALGRGTADGAGRVRLGGVGAMAVAIEPDSGDLVESPAQMPMATDHTARFSDGVLRLRLACDGPFFVNDWSWTPPARQRGDRDSSREPQLRMQRDGEDERTPALPGTSLMGALRAKAEWLAAVDLHKDSKSATSASVVELFGTSAAKARLLLDSIQCRSPGRVATPVSVKLDRFSGGPIDRALFGIECVYDPVFDVRLRLSRDATAQASTFFLERLLPVLLQDGIKLGHGVNRGFGLFHVTREDDR